MAHLPWSLLEHVFPPLDGPGAPPQADREDQEKPRDASEKGRALPENRLDQADYTVARHRMWHESLEVVRDREPLEIARKRQRCLLPAEDENEADEQGPPELRADKGKHGP